LTQRARLVRVLSNLKGMLAPSRGFGPSNCFFRASSAFKIFEVGLWSLELFFRASSAFKIFEAGLRSLELFLSGQQRLQDIRGGASVPRIVFSGQQCFQVIRGRTSVLRIVFFGPAVPSSYSRRGFGPSNCLFGLAVLSSYSRPDFGPSNHLFRASSAFKLFEAGLRSLKSSFSGQQHLQPIRGWALDPRIVFYGLAIPSKCSSLNYGPSKCIPRLPVSPFCLSKG
jgi:hypothetical protein